MRGVYIGETLLIVGSPLIINEFILVSNFNGVDRHAVDQFLRICGVILGELHVDKAGKGVSICSNSNHSVFISVAIYNLLLQSSLLVSRASVSRLLSINRVIAENSLPLLSVELLNRIFLFLFNLRLVILLKSPYLFFMLLLEFQILLHDTMHVIVVDIHVNDFFAFFQALILIFETQFLGKFLFKSIPFIIFVEFCPFSIVYGSLMGLIVFGFITSDVRIHVKCFLMISVDDTSNGIFGVSSSVGFQGCLIKVILIFCISQRASVGFKFLDELFDFFSSFFFAFSFFFELFLANSFSDCNILLITFCALYWRIRRTRTILRVERVVLRGLLAFCN